VGTPRVTPSIDLDAVRVVLLDIEGTTTPLSFVHDVLFPFARARLGDFFERAATAPDTAAIVSALRDEHRADPAAPDRRPPPWNEDSQAATVTSATDYATWLMDLDCKSPALKAAQGLIWHAGYQGGQLRGEVYDDVPLAMRRWRRMGRRVAIYSSGSELAQRLLFASTLHGDLTPLISGFFDTAVGGKLDPASYQRVASRLAVGTTAILFLSDVPKELRAARTAGCQVLLVTRPGPARPEGSDGFEAVSDLSPVLVPGESR
jgi:enolase-phosphatase E1